MPLRDALRAASTQSRLATQAAVPCGASVSRLSKEKKGKKPKVSLPEDPKLADEIAVSNQQKFSSGGRKIRYLWQKEESIWRSELVAGLHLLCLAEMRGR